MNFVREIKRSHFVYTMDALGGGLKVRRSRSSSCLFVSLVPKSMFSSFSVPIFCSALLRTKYRESVVCFPSVCFVIRNVRLRLGVFVGVNVYSCSFLISFVHLAYTKTSQACLVISTRTSV